MATRKSKRKAAWSAEKYRIAILGDELPGLRSTVEGFEASDGYDLRHIDQWSSAKKRRVRDYYEKVHHLFAQPKRIVRPRRKDHLRALQNRFHGDVPSARFKVALIPQQPRLPGAKPRPSRIRYNRRGDVVQSTGKETRYDIAFDKFMLAKDPDAEIKRVVGQMPGARYFAIQVGQFQTLNGQTAGLMAQRVKMFMEKYDGKTPLTSGRHKGNDPANHDWRLWLDGIVGYAFPKNTDYTAMQRAINKDMQAAKQRRAAQDKRMKGKQRKKK